MSDPTLYDRDFYAWTTEQVDLPREGRLAEVDLEHITEEIESMGRSEKRELVSHLTILLLHLLKWQFQPVRQARPGGSRLRPQGMRLLTTSTRIRV